MEMATRGKPYYRHTMKLQQAAMGAFGAGVMFLSGVAWCATFIHGGAL